MRIRAALVEKVGGPFTVTELDLDEPGPGEVLVRIAGAGVCHTDGITRQGDLPFPFPGVLGHEGAGVVEALGEGVTDAVVGDHVVIGWPSCGQCRHCGIGEPRYCDRLGEALVGGHRLLGPKAGHSALRRPDGSSVHGHFFGQSSFGTYALAPASALVVAPKDLPVESLGPLACGLSTGAGTVLHTLRPGPGSSLVVYGAGSVGLAAVMAARSTAATTIIAVDRHAGRLELATSFGATHTVDVTGIDPVQAVKEICGGPADFAIECTGAMSVCRQAVDSVGMLGTCALVGGAPAGAELSVDHLTTLWGKRIQGVLGGGGTSRRTIGTLIDLHRQGRFPFDRLIEYFTLDQVEEALEASYSGAVLKPVLLMT